MRYLINQKVATVVFCASLCAAGWWVYAQRPMFEYKVHHYNPDWTIAEKPGDGFCVHLYHRKQWFGRMEGGHSSWIKDRHEADDFVRRFNDPNDPLSLIKQ